MDNLGPYITYGDLLLELSDGGSPRVRRTFVTLTNKVANLSGDLFDYSVAPGVPAPQIGDVIEQAGFTEIVTEILTIPSRLRVEHTGSLNGIANGSVALLHADSMPRRRGEGLVRDAMARIDLDTGQFFNRRTGKFELEGNNSPLLHLMVPIIEVTQLLINGTDLELFEGEDYDFIAYKGRAEPQDDRRNPKIKLNVRNDSIFSGVFTNRVFLKDTRTTVEGSFGYLEPDGSTPRLIQKAVKRLVVRDLENPTASDAASSSRGGLRRLKVDLHEKEFFELRNTSNAFQPSDDQEYNHIVAHFRRPLIASGSFRELGVEGYA